MCDYLDQEEVREVIDSNSGGAWLGPNSSLYLQQTEAGQVELYANDTLAAILGRAYLGESAPEIMGSWIAQLSAATPISTVFVCGQDLFCLTLEAACKEEFQPVIERMFRLGDCQTQTNYGTRIERIDTQDMLDTFADGKRSIAFVPLIGSQALFAQANFKLDPDMIFASNVKSCQPMDYFSQLLIPGFVAECGVQKVIVEDEGLYARLLAIPSLQPYSAIFKRVGPANPTAAIARKRCGQAVAKYAEFRIRPRPEAGPMEHWIDKARRRLGLTVAAKGIASTSVRNTAALGLFFGIADQNNLTLLRPLQQQAMEESCRSDATPLASISLLLANIKLDLPIEPSQYECVLSHGAERQIWWNDVVKAMTQRFARTGTPPDWIGQIGARAKTVLKQIGMESEHNYTTLRAGICVALPDLANELFPFETFQQQEDWGGFYENMLDGLESGRHPKGTALMIDVNRGSFYFSAQISAPHVPYQRMKAIAVEAEQVFGSSDEQFHLASQIEFHNKRFDEAELVINNWVLASPENKQAWFERGNIALKQRQYDTALESFKRSDALESKGETKRKIAFCLWCMNQEHEAETIVRELMRTDPAPANQLLLGKITYFQQRYQETFDLISSPEVLECTGVYCQDTYACLMAYSRIAPWNDAKAVFEKYQDGLDDYFLASYIEFTTKILRGRGLAEEAVTAFYPKLKIEEEWADAILQVGMALFECRQMEQGEQLFIEAQQQIDKSDAPFWRPAMCLMYGDYSNCDLQRAFDTAHQGLLKFPTSLMLLTICGELAFFVGQDSSPFFERNTRHLQTLQGDERDSHVLRHLALSAANLGRLNDANTLLDEINTRFPNEVCAYDIFWRGLLTMMHGDSPNADTYTGAKRDFTDDEQRERRIEIQHHLFDIEAYGKRGLIANWIGLRETALHFLQLEFGEQWNVDNPLSDKILLLNEA